MSRSIHATRKTVSALAGKKFADPKAKSEALAKARSELRRKRRIKRQVREERRREPAPLAGTSVATIRIEVHDEQPFVHHSASLRDVRALLERLPADSTEGIDRIQLILGKEFIEERFGDEEEEERDPFTRRLSCQLLPGVYAGPCLGTYMPRRGLIAIHAHVYNPDQLLLPRKACELYLRLRALTTLVHEVAHHRDEIRRVRRGRWLADREENVEWYAEKMEYQWIREHVLPYLEKTYPDEVKQLLDWLEHHGGIRLSFEFFAGDPRTTERDGSLRLVFSTEGAFASWVCELPKCPDLAAARLAFARELHYADKYEECLEILDRILSDAPGHLAALTWKGDTLLHLDRPDEAFTLAEQVLAKDPNNADAWEIRGDVFLCRQNWKAVLENCITWEAAVPEEHESLFWLYQHRAVAYCALGDRKQMEVWIEAWANYGNRKRNIEAIRKAVFRRAGREFPMESGKPIK